MVNIGELKETTRKSEGPYVLAAQSGALWMVIRTVLPNNDVDERVVHIESGVHMYLDMLHADYTWLGPRCSLAVGSGKSWIKNCAVNATIKTYQDDITKAHFYLIDPDYKTKPQYKVFFRLYQCRDGNKVKSQWFGPFDSDAEAKKVVESVGWKDIFKLFRIQIKADEEMKKDIEKFKGWVNNGLDKDN